MTDYIDRQAAIDTIKRYGSAYSYDLNNGLVLAMNAINAIQPADVELVKRARWIIRPHKMMGECPCCSECGSFNPIEYRYCPNCGAKMGEKE